MAMFFSVSDSATPLLMAPADARSGCGDAPWMRALVCEQPAFLRVASMLLVRSQPRT
jgi:hypothetical protein